MPIEWRRPLYQGREVLFGCSGGRRARDFVFVFFVVGVVVTKLHFQGLFHSVKRWHHICPRKQAKETRAS
jgi:hypothetical protein